jgi:hypothetical protein
MVVDKRKLTKKQALKLTDGDSVRLAWLLGIGPDAVRRWKDSGPIPDHWSLILVNLLFRDQFGLGPLPDKSDSPT